MSYLGNQAPTRSSTTQKQTVICTGGETTITVAGGYNSFDINVFKNGVKLVQDIDYTASDNSTVVLASQCYAGDIIDITASSNTSDVSATIAATTLSFRNKIINGNFDFWQRGTSTTASDYLADRWDAEHVGVTKTNSRQAFTPGQMDVPGEPAYYNRTVVTSVAGASNYCVLNQPVEGVRTLAGKTATLTFWAKADSSKNIAVEFFQYFGTGGSPSTPVSGIGVTTCALTSSWQKFTVTVAVPSISGKTLGTNENDFFSPIFWFNAGTTYSSRTNSLGQQSGTFDIAQVQLEEGTVATPFEQRPKQVELALCQRYYQVAEQRLQGPVSTMMVSWPFVVQMRATPTLSVISSGTVTSASISASAPLGNYAHYLQLVITTNGGTVYSRICGFDAEL